MRWASIGNLIPFAVDYTDPYADVTWEEFGELEAMPTWIDLLNEMWESGRLPHGFTVLPPPPPPAARPTTGRKRRQRRR